MYQIGLHDIKQKFSHCNLICTCTYTLPLDLSHSRSRHRSYRSAESAITLKEVSAALKTAEKFIHGTQFNLPMDHTSSNVQFKSYILILVCVTRVSIGLGSTWSWVRPAHFRGCRIAGFRLPKVLWLFTYTEPNTGWDPYPERFPWDWSRTATVLWRNIHTEQKRWRIPLPKWLLFPFMGQDLIPR